MSAADTTRALRLIAECLDGLPGLPDVSVTTSARSISVQVVDRGGADETTRTSAVDVLLSLLGGEPATTVEYEDDPGHGNYGGTGHLGAHHVWVFTPMPIPAQVSA